MKEFKEEIKLCSCCGKELSKTNKSGLCKDCFNESRKKKDNLDKFKISKEVVECELTWGKKIKKIYRCPSCNSRIYTPSREHYCFNCGQKLSEISKEEK